MAKVLNVPNGDYYVYVQSGGTIRLDTGIETGEVRVSGDLVVEGNTTMVESEDLSVKDNIITLNDGETGGGVTLQTSGLRIDRGTFADALFVWDETISWTDPVTESQLTGAWHATNEVGGTVAIRTNSIPTGGGDLYLINSGSGVISVTGTNNYEDNVTDDDHIPNKKYLVDYVDNSLATTFQQKLEAGSSSFTYVEVLDFEDTTAPSTAEIAIDSLVVANFYSNKVDLYGLRIDGTTIQVIDSNEDLILSADGTGSVVVNDVFQINSVPGIDDATLEPAAPTDGVKIYTNNEGTGGTGVYFINQDTTRGEMISKNKALVYSMLF